MIHTINLMKYLKRFALFILFAMWLFASLLLKGKQSHGKNSNLAVSLNGDPLEQVYCPNYLGITVDSRLSWDSQCDNLCCKLNGKLHYAGHGLLLTHWGRVTHICVGKLTIIGSDNGLSPGRRQAIFWTNAGILLIGPLGTNFSENSIEILTFSFTKMRLKMSSAKWRPFCLGLNVLRLKCCNCYMIK